MASGLAHVGSLIRFQSGAIGGKKALLRVIKRFIHERYALAKSKVALFTKNGEAVSPEGALEWAKKSSSAGRIRAMLDLVKDMAGVFTSQAELDPDPFHLGVANGVVDLRTGNLIPNCKEYLITRYAKASFHPDAIAPLFLKFIEAVCIGRKDLVEFFQEVLGYVLSGLTIEQAFFLLVGTGANGKSTLVELFFYLLGDYAKSLPGHTFIKSNSRAIRNDIASLPGIRLAPGAEVDTGKYLDEPTLKRTTGGDVITARFIGGEYFDFYLSAKFLFSVNTLPRVTGGDNGIYRRLVVIGPDGSMFGGGGSQQSLRLFEW